MTINSVRLLKTINVTNPSNPTTNYELVLEFADASQRDAFVREEQAIEINAHPPLRAKSARNVKCALITVPKSDASTDVHKETYESLVAYFAAKFPQTDKFQGEIAVIEEQWSALSPDRQKSIIDADETAMPATPAPTEPENVETAAPAPQQQDASRSARLAQLLTALRARLPQRPEFVQARVSQLRSWAQNLRLPTVEELKEKAQSFVNAPSRHPVTLALSVCAGAVVMGFSFMGILIIGAGTYAGSKIREHLYSQPLISPTSNADIPVESTKAFTAGQEAGANWTAYFESFKVKNNWVNALSYGKGLKQKMDENERNTQGNRLG